MSHNTGHPAWQIISKSDSSAVAMRSVAAALKGEYLDVWELSPWQEKLLSLLRLGGKRLVTTAVEHSISLIAVDSRWASKLRTDHLAGWAVSLYDGLEGPWDAIIIGAPNGGVAHIATALGVPFLSQHFLISFREHTHPDDVEHYQAHGAALAESILRRNSDLAVINHYDPLHDRFLVGRVNHIRCKLLDLPEHYEAFIRRNLRPGGTILFTDCRYPWPMYFIGERYWFQVGGLGAVPARAFIEGYHSEIAALQRAAGAEPRGHWGLKGHRAFEMPESEWGALPPLHQRLRHFARENAYNFLAIEGSHPTYFSHLAFRLWRRLLKHEMLDPQGVFVETFTQVAPVAARKAALLPLWVPWNDRESLSYLRRVRRDFGLMPELIGKPLFWLPLPTFSETFDMAPWSAWIETLNGDVHPLGMRPRLYPTDPMAFSAARRELAAWVEAHPSPVTGRATVDMLAEEIRILRRRREW